jgi:proteasome component ECM29
MEGVEKLLDATYSKPETTDKVAAAVEKAARSSLGMPSLAATSRVMVTMFVRYQVRFKPYADRLLKAIEKPIVDRNETVSSSYAYASGYIARYATDHGVMKISDFAWKLWCTSENDRHRAVTAEIFQAISKHAPERFAALSDRLLPFVFVGKHDDQEEVKETFQKTWSDSTSGPRVIILHLKAMVDLAVSLLDDPKWRLKHAGAKAIAEATESVAGLDKLVSPGHAPTVWPALVKALAGKSWDGKEVVLQALAKFVEDVRPFWEKDQAVRSEIAKVSLVYSFIFVVYSLSIIDYPPRSSPPKPRVSTLRLPRPRSHSHRTHRSGSKQYSTRDRVPRSGRTHGQSRCYGYRW